MALLSGSRFSKKFSTRSPRNGVLPSRGRGRDKDSGRAEGESSQLSAYLSSMRVLLAGDHRATSSPLVQTFSGR